MSVPTTGHDLYLLTPSGAPINAHVDASDDDGHMLLSIFPGRRDPMAEIDGREVRLQYTNRRGVWRLDGVATRAAAPLTLDFRYSAPPLVVQRRDFVRVEASVPVSYEPLGPEGWRVDTHTLNVSGGGFLIARAEGLAVGELAHFRVELSEFELLEGVGQAVREMGDGALGIELVAIAEYERQQLVRFVFTQERLARRQARGA